MTNSAMMLTRAQRDALRPKKPYRLRPSPDCDPTVAALCSQAYVSVALLLDLHGTCPRRECRKYCMAGQDDRTCLALFPPEAFDMVCAAYVFAQTASPWLMAAMQRELFSRVLGQKGQEEDEPAP